MTAQLDVEALVGRLRERVISTGWIEVEPGRSAPNVKPDPLCHQAADSITALLAHIAGEDARVAAAVAGERERAATIVERRMQLALDGSDLTGSYYRNSQARLTAAAIRETPSAE